MKEPVSINPLDLYIVREFASDGADCKAIAETHCGLYYEDDDEDSYNCNVIYYRKESRNHNPYNNIWHFRIQVWRRSRIGMERGHPSRDIGSLLGGQDYCCGI